MNLPELTPLPFETDKGFGQRARIGLIVLESDQTIEAEARMLNIAGVDFYHSRIPNDAEVTPTTLTDMAKRIPAAAKLLPPAFGFDAIGYGCTSAATLIGVSQVTELIQSEHPGVACSNPISAATEAFRALQARRIAVVTPYTADVTMPIAQHFAAAGLEVVALGSFLESDDLTVARISPVSIAQAVQTVVAKAESNGARCEGVFVSCTSLRLVNAVRDLESIVGLPVVSSNLALFWHLVRLAGVDEEVHRLGQLFASRAHKNS